MSVNKSFFEDLLRDRKLSLRQLSKRLDVLPSQVSQTFNGKRRMQITEAVKIAQILGAPLNEVMIAAGIEEARMNARRCNVVGCMTGTGEVAVKEPDAVIRTLLPDGLPPDAVAIQARTDETGLSWMDGWLFFVCGENKPEDSVGRFCRVQISGGPQVMATVRRGYESGTYNLSGPTSMSSKRLDWASPVLLTRN
ncbi:helix-turn-helix domain-containing protein [Agrobacterium tumefaciens]|uniref:helix-turn-helix domain-containing protein n=1 Tax=Agrobacterium tumefaciens TaxID=358 RepID=UPI001572E4CE|nr:helix-turn-helix transcriptional regulator [Agrobacterium tumefaciens]